MTCDSGVENWLPNLKTSISQTIKGELGRVNVHSAQNNRSQPDTTDAISNKSIFAHLFKSLKPLPPNLSLECNSDAAMLSIKLLTSALISHHVECYAKGDRDKLEKMLLKLNTCVAALSEFLLSQTKIKIRKINLVKNASRTNSLDVEDLDISASLEKVPLVLHSQSCDDLNEKDHHLGEYQLQLVQNLIQYLTNEANFLVNLREAFELGYDLEKRFPYEWRIHPKFVLKEKGDLSSVQVCIDEHSMEYGFQYQGVTNFVSIPPEQERSLHRLLCCLKDNKFAFFIMSKVCMYYIIPESSSSIIIELNNQFHSITHSIHIEKYFCFDRVFSYLYYHSVAAIV